MTTRDKIIETAIELFNQQLVVSTIRYIKHVTQEAEQMHLSHGKIIYEHVYHTKVTNASP